MILYTENPKDTTRKLLELNESGKVARYIRDVGSVPGSGRSPGGGHGNTLQYSCLENSRDRGAWRSAVHRVAQSGHN